MRMPTIGIYIVLHYRDGGLQHILELHRGYDPLQYPLIFSHGTDGWNINLKLSNSKKTDSLGILPLPHYGKAKCVSVA